MVTLVKDGKRCSVLLKVYICIFARCIKQHNTKTTQSVFRIFIICLSYNIIKVQKISININLIQTTYDLSKIYNVHSSNVK